MKLFKQKLDFDKFCYFALREVDKVFTPNKEQVLDQAQWECSNKLTKKEREELWEQFNFLIPTAIFGYTRDYFGNRYENSEITKRIALAQIYFLSHDKGLDKKQIDSFMDKFTVFIDKLEEELEKEFYQDKRFLPSLGVFFSENYAKDDRTYEQIKGNVDTKNSDKNLTATKLAKTILVKDGILDSLFKSFNITW